MRTPPRGFATIVALMLMALVGTALAAISAGLTADVRRTRNAAADAQLRQLLVAGAAKVEQSPVVGKSSLALPVEISGTVQVEVNMQGEEMRAVVEASVDGRRMGQVLTLRQEQGRWRVVGATLR